MCETLHIRICTSAYSSRTLDDMHASITYINHYTHTLLHHSFVRIGNEAVVSYLLDHGALIDVYESNGSTPLLHAIEHHKTDMALCLLERGMHAFMYDVCILTFEFACFCTCVH